MIFVAAVGHRLTAVACGPHNRRVPELPTGACSVAFAVALAASAGCRGAHHTAPAGPAKGDAIPHTTMPIAIDGEWDEADWAKVALRDQFLGHDGKLARPSSEVRFLHDDHDLIVALYAADEDIRSDDAFDFSVGSLALHVTAPGQVTPAVPGVRAKTGFDEGTLDHPQDDDEEWVVELAIPLARTGLARGVHAPVHAARCDTPHDGHRSCGAWTGSLTLR